jgi:hypothetical protein
MKPKVKKVSPEFVDDLKAVFEKHNWSGHPIGTVPDPRNKEALAALPDCDTGPISCPPGTREILEWIRCPDGSVRQRRTCK